jgi:hypothetical protein
MGVEASPTSPAELEASPLIAPGQIGLADKAFQIGLSEFMLRNVTGGRAGIQV